MEGSGTIRNDLDICPSRRNERPMMVVVDDYCKLLLFGGQSVDSNEKVGGHGIVFEEPYGGPSKDDIIVEGFGGSGDVP